MGLADKLNRLSLLGDKEKEVAKESPMPSSSSSPPPPTYTENAAVEPDPGFAPPLVSGLNGATDPADPDNPTVAQCVAHLKLLWAFHHLRTQISSDESFFASSMGDIPPDVAKEKRWAIYVARAVFRFTVWWNVLPRTTNTGTSLPPKLDATRRQQLSECGRKGIPMVFNTGNLPPLDVLMVWHAYTLNPRNFFEDCHRAGKVDFWATGLPWEAINEAIDPVTFTYNLTDRAVKVWESHVTIEFDNKTMETNKRLGCPNCNRSVEVPWSTPEQTGYADNNFSFPCSWGCGCILTQDVLARHKFIKDRNIMMHDGLMMPGTLFNVNGLAPETKVQLETFAFPNELLKVSTLRLEMLPMNAGVADIRTALEETLASKDLVRRAKGGGFSHRIFPMHKLAIRRMMSHYWNNPSDHGLNLLGAVIRQGTFIGKMAEIDWYHSPSIYSTAERAIIRYKRFIHLMKVHPGRVLVPTLDIDLAWHTHQTQPRSYYDYVIKETNRFIDHDDKIDEGKLSDAFEFTSKLYQRKYNERYSECSCWYCQTIREAHSSTLGRVFGSGSSTFNEIPDDPEAGTREGNHISSHGAIRIDDPKAIDNRKMMEAKLEAAWNKVAERAKKSGKPVPKRPENYRGGADGALFAYYPYAYVGPFYYPPYVADPCIASGHGVYSCEPACYAIADGAVGNCCSGTCGGGVAAGACGGHGAGGGGACAGGCGGGAGGCGGGSTACGGGGGGGSSGGCGGGGGGGGGGCGGGGGGGC